VPRERAAAFTGLLAGTSIQCPQLCSAARLRRNEDVMPEIMDGTTIAAAFAAAVGAYPRRPFLAVPANDGRPYLPSGFELTYGEAGQRVEALAELYRQAGYGVGHRVATLLENRPEHVPHTLALNSIGVCCVPINPDYRAAEIAYLVEHSEPELMLTLRERRASIEAALAQSAHRPGVVDVEAMGSLAQVARPARDTRPAPETPASILYTSGTTGRPKGCVQSHGYEVAAGAWYASLGAWPACAQPRTASTIRCRSIMRMPASCR
jgi:acyl-CoA synthetase (AMP-forming)/AMP-acid ligase II